MKQFFLVMAILLFSCTKHTQQSKPAIDAYKDGFEVIVSTRTNGFVSEDLKNAEKLVLDGASFKLKLDDIDKIKRELEASKKQNKESKYPFVTLEITQSVANEQLVYLAYHFSKSTYRYKYRIQDAKVIPLMSQFTELMVDKTINYE